MERGGEGRAGRLVRLVDGSISILKLEEDENP